MSNRKLLVSRAHGLALSANALPTWAHRLSELHDEQCDFETPPGLIIDPGRYILTDEESEAIFLAQVDKIDPSGFDPDHIAALERFENEVGSLSSDPFDSPLIMSKMVTFIGVYELPWVFVMHRFASACVNRPERRKYANWWYEGHLRLLDFRQDNSNKPAAPTFDADQFSEMATYVRSQGLYQVFSKSDRSFVTENGIDVPTHFVESFIYQLLEKCFIRDPIRNTRVFVNNRMTGEVRSAFARKWPAPIEVEAAECREEDYLFDKHLMLDPTAWTPTDALFSFCQEQNGSLALLSKEAFFKRFLKWGGNRIKSTRKKIGQERIAGYAGVAIITPG
jgi:hypothetical protein